MSSHATIVESTLSALQDLGRPTASWWGVAAGGAPDQFSLAYANALVGNSRARPCLESIATDLVVSFSHDTVVAVAGARADVTVDQVPIGTNQAFHIAAGATVSIRHLRDGLRTYLAVAGGFRATDTFLGSVSPDRTLSFGTDTAPGCKLDYDPVVPAALPRHPFGFPRFDTAVVAPTGPTRIAVLPGENVDLFENDAASLFTSRYHLTEKTDAVGCRLSGAVPRHLDRREILSRALPIGAIEVSGDELLVLNRGRGLSAGYPVVGVISGPSMSALSQLSPGAAVDFRPTTPDAALGVRRDQDHELATVTARMRSLLGSAHPDRADEGVSQ